MRSLLGRFHRPNARSQSEQLFMLNSLGDGSTLSLDFTTGVLDPRLTFTRSTTGTYIGSDGLIKTMAAAPTNDPTKARFDYDPITLTPRGLLIEGAASNLATNSNLQAGWLGGSNTTVTANTSEVTSPDGTNNAAKIALTNAGYCSRFESITGLAASTAHTFSYWIRGTAGNQQRVYSVTAGADLVTQTTLSYSTTGWTRVQINFTTTAAISNVYIYVASRPTGTASDVIYVYGCQLEVGTGASSLIPTGASTGFRAADECQLLNLTTMGFNASEGTIYTDVGVRQNTGSQRNYTFLPASGSNNQIFEGSGIALNVYSSGSFVAQIGTSLLSASKIAAGYAVNDYAVSINGAAVVTDTSGALPSSLTKLTIGGSIVNASAYANGCIRTFKYWPTRLPNAQLQALTT